MQQTGEIILYQPNENVQLEVRLEEETVWLTQAQMAELFQKDRTVVTRHINNVFTEGELDQESNVHFLHIPFSDRPVKLYSLDVIISVGYRVKSQRGAQKVKATIYTKQISPALQTDLNLHNAQYEPIDVQVFVDSHDRFLMIDETVYHIGA